MATPTEQLAQFRSNLQARQGVLQHVTVARTQVLESLRALHSEVANLRREIGKTREEAANALRAATESATSSFTNVTRQLPSGLSDLRADIGELFTAYQGLAQTWEEQHDEMRGQLEEASATWEETVAEIGEEIPEEANAALEELREKIEGELQDAAGEIVEESRERVSEILSDSQGVTRAALEDVMERAAATFQHIASHAESRLSAGLRDSVANFIERAIGETLADVTKGLLTAQAAVTAAASTSPLTPQIIALRPAVGAIKSILDAM